MPSPFAVALILASCSGRDAPHTTSDEGESSADTATQDGGGSSNDAAAATGVGDWETIDWDDVGAAGAEPGTIMGTDRGLTRMLTTQLSDLGYVLDGFRMFVFDVAGADGQLFVMKVDDLDSDLQITNERDEDADFVTDLVAVIDDNGLPITQVGLVGSVEDGGESADALSVSGEFAVTFSLADYREALAAEAAGEESDTTYLVLQFKQNGRVLTEEELIQLAEAESEEASS